jgi:glycerol-3-phosphate O-acyltransferase
MFLAMDGLKYKAKGLREHAILYLSCALLYAEKKWPEYLAPLPDAEIDTYASSMSHDFNWFHGAIYPRFFKKINVEKENLDAIRSSAKEGTIIYITKDIGQLEYNFFNYLFLKEGLPLAKFVNELSLWQWLPFAQIRNIIFERARRFTGLGPLPHPISSGYLGAMIEMENSALIQLKSTAIFNDLYWYSANQDPVLSLLAAHERTKRPIFIVPLDFLWDKRPEGRQGLITNLLPKRIRRIIRFWRNYKNKAVIKIGIPLNVTEAVAEFSQHSITEKARLLRKLLLVKLNQKKRVTTGPALKPRHWIISNLLEDEALQKTIYEVSAERSHSVEDTEALAKKYASEIAADINYHYIETGYRIMQWTLKNIYDGVIVDTDGLDRLKKAAQETPVILVPNHRSHMDYLLLSTILYENNVTLPHVAAGINLSFWPMGHIFRRCGAFFVRRTFANNKLYRAVFKSYLKTLLKEGYCQEFFIEGTRSRTGKLLRPKFGMLTMIAEALREGAAKGASFVPVAITYDEIIEQYKRELEGDAKKGERTRDLFHLPKFFRRKYGKIYVRFGEPVLYNAGDDDIQTSVKKLSNAICVTINKETVATPSAILAASALVTEKRGISRETLLSNTGELANYLRWKGATFSSSVITEAIKKFTASKHIELHDEFDPACYEIKEENRQQLDYYKNNIIHFLVSASCIASIILAKLRNGCTVPAVDEIKDSYLFCKKLFSYEFSFSTRMTVEEHIKRTLSYFEEKKMRVPCLELYKGILTNFFESYLIALLACRNISETEERVLLKKMIKLGHHMYLLEHVTRKEAISNPALKNALQYLVATDIVKLELTQKGRKIYSWGRKDEEAEILKLKLEEMC